MNKSLTKKMVLAVLVLGLALAAMMLDFSRTSVRAQEPIGSESKNDFVPGRVLVKFHSRITPAHARQMVAALGARHVDEIPNIGVHILDLPAQASETAFVKLFESRPEVEFAELDRILAPSDITPNDPWYANWQWHLRKIQAPTAWETTTGASEIVIAILDTGVDGTHEDLASQMVPGWNVFNNNNDTRDIAGHGTHVAGTAAARSNNGIGVASVAWNCRIMPVRVSDLSGYATYSSIANGLNWSREHGARVANVSYAVSSSSTVRSAAQSFYGNGGVVTVSSGNGGTFDSSADNPYVITVGATDQWDALYHYSNRGNNLDLTAPGDSFTTSKGNGYASTGGTSYSSPIIAGVAALMFSVNPNLTPAEVQNFLKQSADDLGAVGWDSNYGYGRVNAARAVALAAGVAAADTTPPVVSFSAPTAEATTSGTVNIEAMAGDNVGITSVNFEVDGTSMGTDTSAPYSYQWNTTLMSNGAHSLTAIARDAAGNSSSASITVNVSNNPFDSSPPTVVITSPSSGSRISVSVAVNVMASDNVAVSKVQLYVDGALISTSTSAPFSTKWNSKKFAVGAHTLQCKVYDAAGNVGYSQVVTVYK